MPGKKDFHARIMYRDSFNIHDLLYLSLVSVFCIYLVSRGIQVVEQGISSEKESYGSSVRGTIGMQVRQIYSSK